LERFVGPNPARRAAVLSAPAADLWHDASSRGASVPSPFPPPVDSLAYASAIVGIGASVFGGSVAAIGRFVAVHAGSVASLPEAYVWAALFWVGAALVGYGSYRLARARRDRRRRPPARRAPASRPSFLARRPGFG
jgi:hypothetical protein